MKGNNVRGIVVVLVAVGLVLVLSAVALVVDMGHVHNVKVQLQRAVDAAALAGAAELDGTAEGGDRGTTAALEVLCANTVDNRPGRGAVGDPGDGWVDEERVEVVSGHWDAGGLGSAARERFAAGEEPADAVMVRAAYEVEHVFALFRASTPVVADAIAYRAQLPPVLPMTLVTCTPTDPAGGVGRSVCDVALYDFAPAVDETAGWSTLIWKNVGARFVGEFLRPGGEGADLFNEVVYGDGTGGLEFADVFSAPWDDVPLPLRFDQPKSVAANAPACNDSNPSRYPNTAVRCGLGGSFDAHAAMPPIPDPLDYGSPEYGVLPRWYHEEHFRALLTMNGFLPLDPGAHQAELELLYRAAKEGDEALFDRYLAEFGRAVPDAFRDGRFARFIYYDRNGRDAEGEPYRYRVNRQEIMRYAGYPKIYVTTGQVATILKDHFVPLVSDGSGRLVSGVNSPFDVAPAAASSARGYGRTLKVLIPVVYAENCDGFTPLSTGGTPTLYFAGTADFLITRLWTKASDRCWQTVEPVSVAGLPGGAGADCLEGDFVPPLDENGAFGCGGLAVGRSGVPGAGEPGYSRNLENAVEGLIRAPEAGPELPGRVVVYLVE